MADFDIRCVNCFHRSHEGKPCPYCPRDTKDNPNLQCKEFVRADLFIARSMARIEAGLGQSHGQLMMALSTIFDLINEAYPEAGDRLKAKLEERQKAAEAEIELQRTKALAEADQALAAAKAAEERREMTKLAQSYVERDAEQEAKGNVLQFPSQPTPEVTEDPTPDPTSEPEPEGAV